MKKIIICVRNFIKLFGILIIREVLSKTHIEQYNYPFVWKSLSLK